MGDGIVDKMFEASLILPGAVEVHCGNEFLSELDASKCVRMPSIDDCFAKNRLIL
jgi:hypothetical protein